MFKSYGSGKGAPGSGGGGSSRSTAFGRVVDVILDPFHPDYGDLGESQSLNGVFYRELDKLLKPKPLGKALKDKKQRTAQ